MDPPEEAGARLVEKCPLGVSALSVRVARRLLRRKGVYDIHEAEVLGWELERGFSLLGPHCFQDSTRAGAQVMTLLFGMVWRVHAATQAREHGRRRASHCRWFSQQGSSRAVCLASGEPLELQNGQNCPSRPCFTPPSRVPLEDHAPLVAPATPQAAEGEERLLRESLEKFFTLSPVLYDVLCRYLEAEERGDEVQIRHQLATAYEITPRSVTNWRRRAGALFLALYTGALDQLRQQNPQAWQIIQARDYDPQTPDPSSPKPFGEIGRPLGLPPSRARALHRQGWEQMITWMSEHGYPESRELVMI